MTLCIAKRLRTFQALGPRGARRLQTSIDIGSDDDRSLRAPSSADKSSRSPHDPRNPRAIHALQLKPLKHEPEFGIPSCDLQLRSFSLQPLEIFSDFSLRAAYYLGLSVSGPIPLPRLIERWTVPKSHFIFKKSQENFERVTLRRMIQVKDGDPESIQLWLAYLRKNQYYGVGMKAQVWEFGEAGLGRSGNSIPIEARGLETLWPHLGQTTKISSVDKVVDIIHARGLRGPSSSNQQLTV